MRVPIRHKLIATYFFISLFTACSIYLVTYFTSEQRVAKLAQDYQVSEMLNEVRNWYIAENTWEGFADYFKTLHPPKASLSSADSQNKNKDKRAGIVTADHYALLNYLTFEAGELIPKAYLAEAHPVRFKGNIVAWVIPPEATGISFNSRLQVVLDNIREALLISMVASILASLIVGWFIAKFAIKPIDSLTKASTAIASGDLNHQIEASTNDEISDLAHSFNMMSKELANADMQRRQLTADITHDLGTPIQVISGYIEMAQDGELELNQQRVRTIASELEHIQRLIKDMSTLVQTDAKTLSIDPTMVSILTVIERVAEAHQTLCQKKNIDLTYDCSEVIPLIHLDEVRIVQVLSNLVSNAIRYVEERGRIKIDASADDKALTIKVSDNGKGISPNDLPHLFERFYRADSSRSGHSGKMGLGLSICKGLIEVQGGTIRVESDGHSYSRFIIEFPLDRSENSV
ncbi:ATP-binding protein [Vibrio sp. F74]|uniref:HAMP domain-containing sensor histidine kinase n=1 Tax=Vibrio sp. F74 TaxID=700020 RepID=UPI0035F57411